MGAVVMDEELAAQPGDGDQPVRAGLGQPHEEAEAGDAGDPARDDALIATNQRRIVESTRARDLFKERLATHTQEQQQLTTRQSELQQRQAIAPTRDYGAAALSGLGALLHGYQAYSAFSSGRVFGGSTHAVAAAGSSLVMAAALTPRLATAGRVGMGLAIAGSLASLVTDAINR